MSIRTMYVRWNEIKWKNKNDYFSKLISLQSKNVEEKAVWDQPTYMNQSNEPVWATKDTRAKQTTATTSESGTKFVIPTRKRQMLYK